MPLTDDTQTMRLAASPSSSAALIRSMLSRLTARTASHWSSLMRASVLSRVMPALWTTMSAPRSARTAGARSDVMSSCSADPPIRLAIAARSSPWAGTSTQITCAPSRASTSAMAAPMPREAPVTAAVWPASGRSQSAGAFLTAARTRITWPDT